MSVLNNVEVFKYLMQKYSIKRRDEFVVGNTDYLDKPTPNELFWGVDVHGRLAINLPIRVVRKAPNKDPVQLDGTICAFQRYTNNTRLFTTGGSDYGSFDGLIESDLVALDNILGGKSVSRTPGFDGTTWETSLRGDGEGA